MNTRKNNFPTRTAGWPRREFLKLASVASAGWAFSRMPLMAGPFDANDWKQVIPADKKLHPAWVKSLFVRGKPQVYTKANDELRYLGMPVGGICCGTLYLGGDGRLWNWDIFNQKPEGVLPVTVRWQELGMDFAGATGAVRNRDGSRYVKPATPADSPQIAQGFALRVSSAGKTEIRPLDATS